MTPGELTDAFERLIAPIRSAAVEIGIVVYIRRDGHLSGVRHIHGTREGVELPVRTIVADALATESRTVVVAHNHPSGDPQVSNADIAITQRLAQALAAVDIRLRDHIILTAHARISMHAKGFV